MFNILLIEDDPIICDVLSRAFRFHGGHRTAVADTKKAAALALKNLRPHLAVVNALVTGGFGIEIANQAAKRRIPVLLMSADPSTGAKTAAHFPVITKPFDVDEVISIAKHMILAPRPSRTRSPSCAKPMATAALHANDRRTEPKNTTQALSPTPRGTVVQTEWQTLPNLPAVSNQDGPGLVSLRLSGRDFSEQMMRMRVWLDRHRYQTTCFHYDQDNDRITVLVTFKIRAQARMFAQAFDGRIIDPDDPTLKAAV